jgi:arginase
MRYTVLGAPTTAGSHNAGQERAPRALREAGLIEALRAKGLDVDDAGDTPYTAYEPQGVSVRVRDLERVTEQAKAVAAGVAKIAAEGRTPIVLGGDCSIEVGVVSGLLSAGKKLVLAYFDGDLDLSTPEDTSSGVLDTMVLSHLFGLADTSLARIGPRFPLLDPGRAHEHLDWADKSPMRVLPVTELDGSQRQIRDALRLLPDGSPVLVHFDLDVIDSGDFPLANFPHFNNGLTAEAAFDILGMLCDLPELAAIVVTEVNPGNDADGTLLRRLITGLADALERR